MLTALQINAAKPAAKAYKLADGGGLYLLVQPSGAKLWRYKFRLAGVEGLDSLGTYPEVSLSQARQAHSESRRLVAQGIHPVQERKGRKLEFVRAKLAREKGSFEVICADWVAASSHGLRPATIRQRERELRRNLLPQLKARQISEISRVEITALLKGVEKRAPEVARNLRGYLWGIFEYAIESGLATANPVPSVRLLNKRSQTNHAALTFAQLGELLRKLDATAILNTQTRVAMLLVILTASRKAEVIEGQWREVDLDAGVWEIPAARMKMGRAHWIPLSRQAIELIRDWRAEAPSGQRYIFPNRRDPLRPMANRSLNALMDRLGFGDLGTPHGMRAVFSTYFNGKNANPDVIEHCLAHVAMGKTRAAYNRHRYKDERRAMLQEWADQVDALRIACPNT